ncbi:MAG: PEP-CTERM/exosortase system-associated acyltransferase [Elusimicrobia bacterium]|nr:PEP-CTERM/exosortase system-associated acyltransferase [Elusimicrobiota bacterium]
MFQYGNVRFQIANTEELVRATQRLRYRVFVEEFGWEKPEDHPEGIETDAFDPYSIHAAASDDSGALIGTARMVLNSPQGLPIFRLLENFDGFNPNSKTVAEFSRLCVHPDFQRRAPVDPHRDLAGNYRFPGARADTTPSQDARMVSVVTHGLIFILHQAGIQLRLTHWLMISEKKLWIFLRRRGILFRPAGKPVDYHGIRIPYIARPDEISHGLAKLHWETRQSIHQEVAEHREIERELVSSGR